MDDLRNKLMRQIREIRGRIDPSVLARAERAAEAVQAGQKAPSRPGPRPVATEPYDKASAREAVELFLQRRADQGRFASDLMDRLKKPDEAAAAYRRPTIIKR